MAKDVELIKQKLNLRDFLSSYLTLLPAGRNFKALCPFHQEKTPSFVVSPDRGIWHCFGCGEGGDVIKFVMKYENLEFPEALRFLAEKAGIPIHTMSAGEQREFGVLYDIHEAATEFFKSELQKNKPALEYLKKRGLADLAIEEFDLGFSPGGEVLTLYLIKKGYDVQDVVRSALSQKSAYGLYRDRFNGRIIFPISNTVGKIVAFTGRILPGFPGVFPDAPKYLNSQETPIFNKSKILYGFHKTKNEIAEKRLALLVEGQMDFLAVWQSGVKNVVAVSGTGLTPHHLEKLRRVADTVVVSFDNDDAGFKALERSLDTFNEFDFHVKVISLGNFKDPSEALESDPGYIQKALENSEPAFQKLFRHYFSNIPDIAGKKRIVRHFLGKIRNLKSAVEKTTWLKELSTHSGISEVSLATELEELRDKAEVDYERQEAGQPLKIERYDAILARLFAIAFTRNDFWDILAKHKDWLSPLYREVIDNPKSEKASFFEMQSGVLLGDSPEVLKNEFDELLYQLQLICLKKEQAVLKEKMKKAEAAGDEGVAADLLGKLNAIAKKVNDLTLR